MIKALLSRVWTAVTGISPEGLLHIAASVFMVLLLGLTFWSMHRAKELEASLAVLKIDLAVVSEDNSKLKAAQQAAADDLAAERRRASEYRSARERVNHEDVKLPDDQHDLLIWLQQREAARHSQH